MIPNQNVMILYDPMMISWWIQMRLGCFGDVLKMLWDVENTLPRAGNCWAIQARLAGLAQRASTKNIQKQLPKTFRKHYQNIEKTLPNHPENIPKISRKHHQMIQKTSPNHLESIPKSSRKHPQIIQKASPKHPENIPKTSRKHFQSIQKTSQNIPPKHFKTSPKTCVCVL